MLRSIKFLSIVWFIVFPTIFVWWALFIPVSLLSYWSRSIYAPIVAGLILDLLYLGKYPFFLLSSIVFSVLFAFIRGRIAFL
jgi:hypothetical protein